MQCRDICGYIKCYDLSMALFVSALFDKDSPVASTVSFHESSKVGKLCLDRQRTYKDGHELVRKMETKINWGAHKWALFFCGISTFGALCYGYDQIYYTGVQGMTPFINDYGQTTDSDGNPALTTSFLSLTASIIYVGELAGAFIAAPINDFFGRRAVFFCASLCIIG